MIGKQIIEDKEVTITEAKSLLAKRKKEGELSYEQQLAHDYTDEFGRLAITKAKDLVESLSKIEGIDTAIAVQIADNLPATKADLLVVLEKRKKGLSDADSKKVLDLVAKAQE